VAMPVTQPKAKSNGQPILLAFGFADANALGRAVRSWIQLFEIVQPDSVLLDYAPAAQLAAQLLWVWAKYDGAQVITLGDGNDYVDVGRGSTAPAQSAGRQCPVKMKTWCPPEEAMTPSARAMAATPSVMVLRI